MNILNWILFVLLNICLSSRISGTHLISNIFELAFFWGERYLFCAFLWFLFVFPLQFVFLPILYEFINKKSQIFLFLNKQKNLIFCLKSLFLALVADVFFLIPLFISLEVTFEYFLFLLSFCFCFGTIFAGYFGLAIWLRLRKCILFRLRKNNKIYRKMVVQKKICNFEKYNYFFTPYFRDRSYSIFLC